MNSDDQYTRFRNLDRSSDPAAAGAYLDRASAQTSMHTYKAESFALLAPRPGDTLLEVGCGTGTDVRALAAMVAPGGRVVGVDLSETLLTEARRRGDVAGATIEFRRGDVNQLEFPDGVFDGCRADRIFQHLTDPPKALGELVRVVRQGAPTSSIRRTAGCSADWSPTTRIGIRRAGSGASSPASSVTPASPTSRSRRTPRSSLTMRWSKRAPRWKSAPGLPVRRT
jgi:SAM-dependent methyltransferase